jgi:hypothetical protein
MTQGQEKEVRQHNRKQGNGKESEREHMDKHSQGWERGREKENPHVNSHFDLLPSPS